MAIYDKKRYGSRIEATFGLERKERKCKRERKMTYFQSDSDKVKEKGNYVFPSKIAYAMKHISQRTIYEAGMLSMIFIMIGLIFMLIYIPFFTNSSLALKIGTAVNCLAGFVLLGSWLTNQFQQYQSYLMVMGIIEDETTITI